jgi:hypothetical protein
MNKTNKKIERVAFFGDADAKENETHYQLAFKTAELLAKEGFIIVNGGGPGVMAAATLGAKAGGGLVELSVLSEKNKPTNYEGQEIKNVEVADKVYEMNNYEERMNKLVEIADAYVIFKGGTGTLAEVGLVWSKAKFDFGNHEPIIFVGEEWNNLVPEIEKQLDLEKIEKEVVAIVRTPEEVLETLRQVEN